MKLGSAASAETTGAASYRKAVLAAGSFGAPLAKTAAGRPVLAPTEVEIALQPDLELDGVRAGLMVEAFVGPWAGGPGGRPVRTGLVLAAASRIACHSR